MASPLLALFTRSMREDVRSKATYWTRIGIGGFILFILLGTAVSSRWFGAPGLTFFKFIVYLQAVAITFIGLSYFASAVAEEKEEQTLGLLRMTDLNPLSILLGKSTSRLCGALLVLAAQLPFTIFAVTLGGVSLGQILATYVALGAFTFLLCNVALLGSVLTRSTAHAAVFSVLVVGLLVVAGPLLGLVAHAPIPSRMSDALASLGGSLWQATLIARLMEILSTGFVDSPASWQVGSNVAIGVVCFLLAWAAFDRFCDRTSDEAVASGPVPRPAIGLRLGRPPRPVHDALFWKDYHFLCGGRMGMIVRVTCYGAALFFALLEAVNAKGNGPGGMQAVTYSLVPFVFSIDVAVMASRIFRSELRDQTLSALAVLPFTIRQLAYRKARACLLAATPGALCVGVGGILFLSAMSAGSGEREIRIMMLTQTVSSWVNVIMLVHVVAWLSLLMKRGALPVGYVATQAFHTFITMVCMAVGAFIGFAANFGSGGPGTMSFLFFSPLLGCVGSLIVAGLLHRAIPARLEALAGEG